MIFPRPDTFDLPIGPFLDEIARIVVEEGAIVLTAEPGAGKTSLVPLHMARELGAQGKVLLVEPRRLAAISAAARLAELSDARLGGEVGYRVRGDTRVSPDTRIEVVTGGVLVRMLGTDPFLEDVAVLIFDEFHERSLDMDLGLALALQARSARIERSLHLVMMSATIDAREVSAFLGASVLAVPGRLFPVDTRHASSRPTDIVGWISRAIVDIVEGDLKTPRADVDGDILVFLPGMAEIIAVESRISERSLRSPVEILKLHSSLPLTEQRRAILPARDAPRRVILSTSIAETSLTVPRVSIVIDCGLVRRGRFDRRSGLNRLVTEFETMDRAEQRRGRAGRLGPGLCVRAWPEAERLLERAPPEILVSDLAGLVLECLNWGAKSASDLEWITPPPKAPWEDGISTLQKLGALTLEGGKPVLTKRGIALEALGMEPRLGALALSASSQGDSPHMVATACLAAALLELSPGSESLDFSSRFIEAADTVNPGTAAIREEAKRIATKVGSAFDPRKIAPELLPAMIATAWPDRIARRLDIKNGQGVFMIPAGRHLRAGPPLGASEWIVALEADAGQDLGRIHSGIALDEQDALRVLGALADEKTEIDWRGRSYRARRVRSVDMLELSAVPSGQLERDELSRAICARLAKEGLSSLRPDEEVHAFLLRYRYWRRLHLDVDSVDIEVFAEGQNCERWLSAWIDCNPADVLPGHHLRFALESRLSPEVLALLQQEAPEICRLPGGRTLPLIYGDSPQPILEGRIHEFFGLEQHPKVGGKNVVIRLLTPAGRPIQTTADLPGFWRGAWQDIRKELRGSYPKHHWPEDPATAPFSRNGLKPRGDCPS